MEVARQLGAELAGRGLTLVYGGSHAGLMGAVSAGAIAAGGEVIGVIPEGLLRKEAADMSLRDLRIVGTMHERKALMADLADAFIALPGGTGTLDEFAEIVTWAQIGLHRKPIGLLNQDGYYTALLAFLDHAVAERFLRPEHRALIREASNLDDLFSALQSPAPVDIPKWLDCDAR
jgi:uncharacterized protein (TIGR00730 family)